MDWFKMHYEARNDAKLRALSDQQHRIWFNMLCYSSEQKERGVIPAMKRFLLAVEVSGGDVDALETTIGLLSALRIIQETDEGIRFVNFNKRNYEKPSASPEKVKERVRKHREKHAQAESNTQETPLPDDVTPCNALDTDTDTDTDTEIDKDNIIVPTAVETIKPGGQEFEGKKTATKQYAFDDEHLELAQKLLDCILEHKPNFKAPKTLDQWANTMRLMIEQDKRRPAVIASIIAWSQKDQFWQNNILSADTLRKQFDRLEGQQSKAVKVLPDKQAQPKSQAAVQQAREMFYARGGRV